MSRFTTPFIGLVTVLYKSDAVLPDFFESLARQRFQHFQLFLVDNSCSPESSALIASYCAGKARYHHIDSGGNIGVAAGNNLGVRRSLDAGCTHTLLLNNDILIEGNDCFDQLLETSLQRQAEMVVPLILYYGAEKIWMAGGRMDNFRALGVHSGYNQPVGGHHQERAITYAPTCFMLVDNKVFASTGLMDEAYFAYYDDTDFVYRALRQGHKLWYTPKVVIRHKVSISTGGDDSPFYIYYGNRNKIYFVRKHYHPIHAFWTLAYFFLARILFFLQFTNTQRAALVRGIKSGFAMKIGAD